jgi:hypothetical protein
MPVPRARASLKVTKVQLGRFLDGRLELFNACIGDREYIAVSQIWGKVEWLRVDGVERDVYASPQKAKFIRGASGV